MGPPSGGPFFISLHTVDRAFPFHQRGDTVAPLTILF